MAEIHFLNVGDGDCCLIKSNSNRWTMFDVCNGNKSEEGKRVEYAEALIRKAVMGNFAMRDKSINPINYAADTLNISSIFRFILSHPDMDHMDGLKYLFDKISVSNYWDNGIRREKPDFTQGRFQEKDWTFYEKIIKGEVSGLTIISPLAGSRGQYYNKNTENESDNDYLYIYAPNVELVTEANKSGDINDASYVVCYRSSGGRVLLCGDSHNKTWEIMLKNYKADLVDCELMIAPHHGRDSDRDWGFLDEIKPKFGILGCADSKDLAYNEWNKRKIDKITQNQAGNIAIYPDSHGLKLYVENSKFADSYGGDIHNTDSYGNYYLTYIGKSANY